MNPSPAPIDFTEEVRARQRAAWTPERRAAQSERLALNLTGERFGRLVAVRRLGKRGNQGFEWECQCECGGSKAVVAAHLRKGIVQSCGCLRPEVHAAPRHDRRLRPYEHLFNRLVYTARSRRVECCLTYEEFVRFVAQEVCFYCGGEVEWAAVSSRKKGGRLNLDRKDNTRGYVAENLVVCCWPCNDGKGNRYTFEEWSAMAEALRLVRNG